MIAQTVYLVLTAMLWELVLAQSVKLGNIRLLLAQLVATIVVQARIIVMIRRMPTYIILFQAACFAELELIAMLWELVRAQSVKLGSSKLHLDQLVVSTVSRVLTTTMMQRTLMHIMQRKTAQSVELAPTPQLLGKRHALHAHQDPTTMESTRRIMMPYLTV